MTEIEAEEHFNDSTGYVEVSDLVKNVLDGKLWPLSLGLVEIVKPDQQPEAIAEVQHD